MADHKCPRCRTASLVNGKCLSCGHKKRSAEELRKLIEANAEEIAQDYSMFGASKVYEKWDISASTLYRIPQVRNYMKKPRTKRSPDGIPPFPIFSDSWASDVQLKWLEIWEVLQK